MKKMKELNKQRKDYLTWDEYFMGIAVLSAQRSKDPSTQVGACIVSEDNHILSIGYNGTPNGWEDRCFCWDREGNFLDTKYPYVCHAELNAISNYMGNKRDFKGAKIYVTLFPCEDCTKLIIQNGIKEVIYLCDKYKDTDGVKASKLMFDTCGIKYKEFPKDQKEKIELNIK